MQQQTSHLLGDPSPDALDIPQRSIELYRSLDPWYARRSEMELLGHKEEFFIALIELTGMHHKMAEDWANITYSTSSSVDCPITRVASRKESMSTAGIA